MGFGPREIENTMLSYNYDPKSFGFLSLLDPVILVDIIVKWFYGPLQEAVVDRIFIKMFIHRDIRIQKTEKNIPARAASNNTISPGQWPII